MTDTQNVFSEFQDPVRDALIKQLIQQNPEILTFVPRHARLALWFSEISTLKRYVEEARSSALGYVAIQVLILNGMEDCVGLFATTKQQPTSQGGAPETYDRKRDNVLRSIALKRDKYRCALTAHGHRGLLVCHIVPHKVNGSKREGSWQWLQNFWGKDKVDSWRCPLRVAVIEIMDHSEFVDVMLR